MEATVLRHDVLLQLDTGDPFDLIFITCDRTRGTGGKIKVVKQWQKVKGEHLPIPLRGRVLKKEEQALLRRAPGIKIINIYNPNDAREHVTAVHYRLMAFFNGKRIID